LPGAEATDAASGPDLEVSREVTLTAGRIREVFLRAEPIEVQSGPGARARVTVRLVDRAGNAVTDETVQVSATEGAVDGLELRPDGTWEATWRPPPSLQTGRVLITASGRQGEIAASTEVHLVPRSLSRAVGFSGGYQTNFGSLSSGVVEIVAESRLPILRDRIVARLSAGHFADRATLTDEQTGAEVSVRTVLDPIAFSLLVRQERGLRASWLGAGLLALAWNVETTYGQDPMIEGYGLSGPGFQLLGGTGLRIGLGEVGVEIRYLQVGTTQGAVRYRGQVGGVAPLLGYRFLF